MVTEGPPVLAAPTVSAVVIKKEGVKKLLQNETFDTLLLYHRFVIIYYNIPPNLYVAVHRPTSG